MLIRSPKELALFVISQRRKLKLSQADVAKRVGLQQKTISAFENKPESTQVDTLFLILSAVNFNMNLLPKDISTWQHDW